MHINVLKPLVAIHCLVYNHELYLRDCFEGFVMQQTNFPFVAIVHDDASTDGSAVIIREYEEKYPHIFKPIYEKENRFSQHDDSLAKIMTSVLEKTKAKYVAMCEGDDYWIDPLKLQKQVDFLESNSDYGFIGAKCKIQKNNILSDEIYPIRNVPTIDGIERHGDVFVQYAIYGPVTRTCTLLYRKSILDGELMIHLGDYYLQAILASKSKFACLSSVSCVYRIHNMSVSHNHTDIAELAYINWFVEQRRMLNIRFPKICCFSDDELNDMIEYKKMQIAVKRLKYFEYIDAKTKLTTIKMKNKILYRIINSIVSFYIFGVLYKLYKFYEKSYFNRFNPSAK